MQTRLILASSSPRRMDLLRQAGVTVEVIPSTAEELHDPSLDFRVLCTINAERKARDVASQHPGSWVIGADTLVCLDGQPLGKPSDLSAARVMLQALSGRVNQVCTGVCVIDAAGRANVFYETSEVEFLPLSDEVIDDYMSKVNTLDKAGAYAAQEHGEQIIAEVRGDFSNVVGLPMKKLLDYLANHGEGFPCSDR
jgi:septum formation protein